VKPGSYRASQGILYLDAVSVDGIRLKCPWKEHEVLAVALLIERKLGGWKRDFREANLTGPRMK